MVKIDNKQMFNKMNPRKMEKIQIYPSKQHCGYNKMSNQLPKLTKTIMSPLTTMPPKKMMISPHNGVTIKPNPTTQQATLNMKVEANEKAAVAASNNNNAMQISAIKNNFAAKTNTNVMSSPKVPPITIAPTKTEPKIVDKVKDAAAASYRSDQISLYDVHPYITCFLCRGYLIEATTIVECLHTYCHSCLMKHLAREKCCPQCDMSINKSKTNIK
jgi:Zinc finger, C3HC4 type (RING finger)